MQDPEMHPTVFAAVLFVWTAIILGIAWGLLDAAIDAIKGRFDVHDD